MHARADSEKAVFAPRTARAAVPSVTQFNPVDTVKRPPSGDFPSGVLLKVRAEPDAALVRRAGLRP